MIKFNYVLTVKVDSTNSISYFNNVPKSKDFLDYVIKMFSNILDYPQSFPEDTEVFIINMDGREKTIDFGIVTEYNSELETVSLSQIEKDLTDILNFLSN